MATGWLYKDAFPAHCLEGETAHLACTNAGGVYWQFSDSQPVCTFGGTTISAVGVENCNPDILGEKIPHLNSETAMLLLVPAVSILGLAWIFKQARISMLNK